MTMLDDGLTNPVCRACGQSLPIAPLTPSAGVLTATQKKHGGRPLQYHSV